MSRTGEVPYTWEEIENEVRDAILAQASILGTFGPGSGEVARAYLGIDFEEWNYHAMSKEEIGSIDITRHNLHYYARNAYIYAYQLDGAEAVGSDIWHDVDGLLEGFPQTDAEGERSPFCTLNDFPLRRMLETFYARWSLYNEEWCDWGLTVRQLSLLANMTVPAVRTSLSKEGFRLEKSQGSFKDDDRNYRLPRGDALLWLSRRRGYIPNRATLDLDVRGPVVAQLLANPELDFSTALARILDFTGDTAETLGQKTGQAADWLQGLLAGEGVAPDLPALRALAQAVGAPEPEFVGRAVTHLLSLERGAA